MNTFPLAQQTSPLRCRGEAGVYEEQGVPCQVIGLSSDLSQVLHAKPSDAELLSALRGALEDLSGGRSLARRDQVNTPMPRPGSRLLLPGGIMLALNAGAGRLIGTLRSATTSGHHEEWIVSQVDAPGGQEHWYATQHHLLLRGHPEGFQAWSSGPARAWGVMTSQGERAALVVTHLLSVTSRHPDQVLAMLRGNHAQNRAVHHLHEHGVFQSLRQAGLEVIGHDILVLPSAEANSECGAPSMLTE